MAEPQFSFGVSAELELRRERFVHLGVRSTLQSRVERARDSMTSSLKAEGCRLVLVQETLINARLQIVAVSEEPWAVRVVARGWK